jgi:transglutaminase-like putative cysteine protease
LIWTGLWLCTLALIGPAALAAPPSSWESPARYEFEYRLDASSIDPGEAKQTRIWIPHPAENSAQRLVGVEIDSPWPHRVTRDELGNRIIYIEGAGRPDRDVVVRTVVERAPYRGTAVGAVETGGPLDPKRFLEAPRLIPLQGLIAYTAEREVRGTESKGEAIWALYDYVYRTMRYDKQGSGWGRGDAVWACTRKRGNCTDFHSLFIGMALSRGIPARFVMGFPIPPDDVGGPIDSYHCWAEYYDENRGWVPLDASEAKKSGQKVAYFGVLPNDRIELTSGRDLMLVPAQSGERLNYFIYPYIEVDGRPLDGVQATFAFKRL